VGGPPLNAAYDEKGAGAPPWRGAFRSELENEVVGVEDCELVAWRPIKKE